MASLIGTLLIAVANAREVEVFTDRQHPVTSAEGFRIIQLDVPAQREADLTAQFPSDFNRATEIVRQRLCDGGRHLQRKSRIADQEILYAWTLGIAHIPAAVHDRGYVIYGESDAARAVARIEAYRSAHP